MGPAYSWELRFKLQVGVEALEVKNGKGPSLQLGIKLVG